MTKKVVDLFSGCGGLSLGFNAAGFDVVAAYEYWDAAIDCYNKNFKSHQCFKQDLSQIEDAIKKIKEKKPDIIIGGPPCQDFSTAGKRIEGARAALTDCYAEIVSKIKPSFFLMENVAAAQKSDTYQKARKRFKKAGYGLTEMVLDASLYGVPQKRKRFVCIGHLGDQDRFLSNNILSRESIFPTTVRDKYPNFPVEYYYRHPRSYTRRGIFSIDEPAPTVRGVNRRKPPTYKMHPKDAHAPEGTIVQSLTYTQRALLQTFPVNYIWPDNIQEAEIMIGNAVPVELVKNIALAIAEYQSKDKQESTYFEDWLKKEKGLSPNTAKNTVSSLRKINNILKINTNTVESYLKKLEKEQRFINESNTSKARQKRSFKLYLEYIETIK